MHVHEAVGQTCSCQSETKPKKATRKNKPLDKKVQTKERRQQREKQAEVICQETKDLPEENRPEMKRAAPL